MKKRMIIAALAVLVLCTSSAMAGLETEYKVRRGETLWGISHRTWGTGKLWQEIAKENKISDPKKLKAGQILRIPEIKETIKITNYNTSPYGARAMKGDPRILAAIDKTFYSAEVKKTLKRFVSENSPSPYILVKGEKMECVSDKLGVYCSTFGYEFMWEKIGALGAYIWSAEIGNRKYEIFVIEICGNFASRSFEVPQMKIIPPETVPAPPELEPPETEEIPPVTEEKIPPVIVPEVPSEELPPAEIRSCPECKPELEVDGGIAVWVHDPRGDGRTTGKNIYAQVMYWENFEADCSSEYWYGLGGIGSAYNYSASRIFAKGKGWRAAGQVGLKRNYSEMGKDGIELERSWKLQARLGWEKSTWENRQLKIERRGQAYGPYAEYNRELTDKLKLVAQVELWMGKFDSQTFLGTFVGLDYKFADRWTLRAGPGYDYQGWDHLSAFAPQAQIMYDLPNRNGRIAFGTYEKFYAHIGPTFGLLGRYESGDLIKKLYGQSRRREYRSAGVGIGGGNVEPPSETVSNEPVEEIPATDVNIVKVADGSPRIQFDKNGEPATLEDQAKLDREVSRTAWPNTQ